MIHVHPATAYGDPREPGHGERIVRYLYRYVSGMVMSNHRLISMDEPQAELPKRETPPPGSSPVERTIGS